MPLIAGILEMDYWKFQLANVLSAMVWAYVLLAFGDFGIGIVEVVRSDCHGRSDRSPPQMTARTFRHPIGAFERRARNAL